MRRVQKRITIDSRKWAAIEAMANAKETTPSMLVEQGMDILLDPSDIIKTLLQRVSELNSNMIETRDQIAVISDFIIDLYKAQNVDMNEEGDL